MSATNGANGNGITEGAPPLSDRQSSSRSHSHASFLLLAAPQTKQLCMTGRSDYGA
jgi:hypothetical protein